MSEETQTQEGTTDLAVIREKISNNQLANIVNSKYPVSIQNGFNNIITNVLAKEKQLTDLYPELLAEIPISTSQLQDTCVQYEQHFTPHKKLRQSLLELQDKLAALYTAKTGNKKSILKVERTKLEIENLQYELGKLEENDIYSKKRLSLTILEKEVDLEEDERSLNSSVHLIKDAMLKVMQHEELIKKYRKEVEASGLSFEESEAEYYVIYFTSDVEKQLRTANRIDTGTFGAIAQLPEQLRLKVLKNITFLKHKLFDDNYHPEGDYLWKVYYEQLKPVKTGEGEMEGLKISEFIGMDTIKILSPVIAEEN